MRKKTENKCKRKIENKIKKKIKHTQDQEEEETKIL